MTNKIDTIIERIKAEGKAGIYGANDHMITSYQPLPFGVTLAVESDLLWESQKPNNRFSSWNFLLPKPLRSRIKCLWRVNLPVDQLYLFHYPFSYGTLKSKFGQFQGYGESPFSDSFTTAAKEFCSEQPNYVKQLQAQLGDASVIYPFALCGGEFPHFLIVGESSLMQEAMDELKREPQRAIDFSSQLSPYGKILPRNPLGAVHLYDLINRPKEVHYEN